MRHAHRLSSMVATAALCALSAACNRQQRPTADSAAGAVADSVRAAFSVIDIDMGRQVDADRRIADKTDDFASTDTIYTLHVLIDGKEVRTKDVTVK